MDEIRRQVKFLCSNPSNPETVELAQSIRYLSTTDITLGNHLYEARHSPDASFNHVNAKYPALVIETSFSQKEKDIPRLVDEYLIGSNGSIKMLLNLNIKYNHSKRATVSMWEVVRGVDNGVAYGAAVKTIDSRVSIFKSLLLKF